MSRSSTSSVRIRTVLSIPLAAAILIAPGCSTFMMQETKVLPDEKEVTTEVASAKEQEPSAPTAGEEEESLPPDMLPSPDGTYTKFYKIRHVMATELVRLVNLRFFPATDPGKKIDPTKEHAKLQVHQDLNMLILNEKKERLEEIVEYLEKVDRLTTQVEIKVTVVEISTRYQFEYGFDFFLDRAPASNAALRSIGATYENRSFLDSLLTGSQFQGTTLTFGSVGSVVTEIGDLSLVLRALEERGYAKILAEPSIVIHGGETAEINAIQKQPIPQLEQINPQTTRITTRYEDVGVKFKVTVLNVGTEGAVLSLNPEVSTVTTFTDPQTFGGLAVPVIAQRTAKTVLDVLNGDRFAIGGLKDSRVLVEHRKVPILGSIPLIGNLFKSRRERKEETNIMFLLEVTIVDESRKAEMQVHLPGEG